jgi:hypothetical protein
MTDQLYRSRRVPESRGYFPRLWICSDKATSDVSNVAGLLYMSPRTGETPRPKELLYPWQILVSTSVRTRIHRAVAEFSARLSWSANAASQSTDESKQMTTSVENPPSFIRMSHQSSTTRAKQLDGRRRGRELIVSHWC